MDRDTLIKLKEMVFTYIFLNGYFDLDLMKKLNIFFDNVYKELN